MRDFVSCPHCKTPVKAAPEPCPHCGRTVDLARPLEPLVDYEPAPKYGTPATSGCFVGLVLAVGVGAAAIAVKAGACSSPPDGDGKGSEQP